MNLPYLPRLVCLAAACFFFTYGFAALALKLCATLIVRLANARRPDHAARLLFALRLLPAALGAFIAFGLCVPGYLAFEPDLLDEPVGLACLLPALACFTLFAVAVASALRALTHSLIFARRCRESGAETSLSGRHALIVESAVPCLALTGILRPRVVISRRVLECLSGEEISAVLSHEFAHRAAWDNLKRLCLLLAPGPKALGQAWIGMAEYAADREAVGRDRQRALALASALVRVARLGSSPASSPLATSFLADAADLSRRVDLLLSDPPDVQTGKLWPKLAVAAIALPLVLQPAVLRLVHAALEHLMQ